MSLAKIRKALDNNEQVFDDHYVTFTESEYQELKTHLDHVIKNERACFHTMKMEDFLQWLKDQEIALRAMSSVQNTY